MVPKEAADDGACACEEGNHRAPGLHRLVAHTSLSLPRPHSPPLPPSPQTFTLAWVRQCIGCRSEVIINETVFAETFIGEKKQQTNFLSVAKKIRKASGSRKLVSGTKTIRDFRFFFGRVRNKTCLTSHLASVSTPIEFLSKVIYFQRSFVRDKKRTEKHFFAQKR